MSEINWAAVAPILVLLMGFVVWCWIDISRVEVRYLPKWLWAVICIISIPIGAIVYLLIGRDTSPIR